MGVKNDIVKQMADQIGYSMGVLPFSYLGLPIVADMSKIRSWDTMCRTKIYTKWLDQIE